MATTWTQTISSGILTNVVTFSEGPLNVMKGHYSAPNTDTAIIETGMYIVTQFRASHVDGNTVYLSTGANSTYAVLFSGASTGLTGWFKVKGH